jgi:hypothetical protein
MANQNNLGCNQQDGHVGGAPGPVAGASLAGLPVLAVGYGVFG